MPLVTTTFQNRPPKYTYYKELIDMYVLMDENGISKIVQSEHTYYKRVIDMYFLTGQNCPIKM